MNKANEHDEAMLNIVESILALHERISALEKIAQILIDPNQSPSINKEEHMTQTLRDQLVENIAAKLLEHFATLRMRDESDPYLTAAIKILDIPELREAIKLKERHDELCGKSCQEMWEGEYKREWRFPTAKLGWDKK